MMRWSVRPSEAGEASQTTGGPMIAGSSQVAGSDKVAVNVFRFLAGDEHHPDSGRDDDVGVGGGSGQVFGVDELECHSAFRPDLSINNGTSVCPSPESLIWAIQHRRTP